MSADQQRLNYAIQQIAERAPRVRALLKANDNKGGKPGAAGVGSSTDAESQRICCDGSVSDNANPGVEERDPDADGAGQSGGLNSSDPAKLDMGEGTLSGVTDCETGQPICFDGSGFIPPDGWDDPSSPGPVDSFQEGRYWAESQFGKPSGRTEWTAEQRCSPFTVGATGLTARGRPFAHCLDVYDNIEFVIYQWGCDEFPEDLYDDGICEEEPDPQLATEWPSDGCVNLAIVSGSIVGSKYDPENDGSYSSPVQEKEVCDAATGDRILLRVDTNSTYKSIKSLDGDIDPDTQAGYLYETGTGRRIRQISPSEFRDDTV